VRRVLLLCNDQCWRADIAKRRTLFHGHRGGQRPQCLRDLSSHHRGGLALAPELNAGPVSHTDRLCLEQERRQCLHVAILDAVCHLEHSIQTIIGTGLVQGGGHDKHQSLETPRRVCQQSAQRAGAHAHPQRLSRPDMVSDRLQVLGEGGIGPRGHGGRAAMTPEVQEGATPPDPRPERASRPDRTRQAMGEHRRRQT